MAFHCVPWRALQAISFHLQAQPRCESLEESTIPRTYTSVECVLFTPSDLIAFVLRVHGDHLLSTISHHTHSPAPVISTSKVKTHEESSRTVGINKPPYPQRIPISGPFPRRRSGPTSGDLTSTREESQLQQTTRAPTNHKGSNEPQGLQPNQTSRRQLPVRRQSTSC